MENMTIELITKYLPKEDKPYSKDLVSKLFKKKDNEKEEYEYVRKLYKGE